MPEYCCLRASAELPSCAHASLHVDKHTSPTMLTLAAPRSMTTAAARLGTLATATHQVAMQVGECRFNSCSRAAAAATRKRTLQSFAGLHCTDKPKVKQPVNTVTRVACIAEPPACLTYNKSRWWGNYDSLLTTLYRFELSSGFGVLPCQAALADAVQCRSQFLSAPSLTPLPGCLPACPPAPSQTFWFLSYFPEPLSLTAQSLLARDRGHPERAAHWAWLLLR